MGGTEKFGPSFRSRKYLDCAIWQWKKERKSRDDGKDKEGEDNEEE